MSDLNIEKNGRFSFLKGFFTKKRTIILIAAILCVALLCFFLFGRSKKNEVVERTYVEAAVSKGNVVETIEQSGTVEPYERYEITSLAKGEILLSPFEEGDMVEEGDVLYQIDDEDAQLNMEKAQMSLDEINEDVSNLNIYANASGRLSDFSLEVGDQVGNGIIGRIVNTDTLQIDVPFSLSDFEKISVGDAVTITSALYMTSLPGTVTHKYYANTATGSESSILRKIEIEISNPGALAENTTFAATVHTSSGDVNSSGSGVIDSGNVYEVRAEVTGTVSYVGFKDGDYVEKDQLIARLTNKSLLNSQKSSQLNVRSNQKSLDNYKITSPIAGTIITKNSKAGDKIDNSNSQTVMMVVADMSKMKFTISVDELDISDIHLGQTAVVDADALPDESFEAKVTTIASEGVSSGDGVTTYSIELTIDKPGNLKSGMNVNANILINEAYDVLTIPEDALMSVRGTSAMVMVKAGESPKTGDAEKSDNKQKTDKMQRPDGQTMQRPDGQKMQMPSDTKSENSGRPTEMPKPTQNNNIPTNSSGKENNNAGGKNQNSAAQGNRNLPEGYEMRMIEIGVSDGRNVEVVSGLSEGDIIAYIPSSASSGNNFFGMMRGMSGGRMPQGGMPTGGMNNRSGGMTRTR